MWKNFECKLSKLEHFESRFIDKYDSKYPNGLNLPDDFENEINYTDTIDVVMGQVYIITNKMTKKSFIGQTKSHIIFDSNIESINYGKYKPFGFINKFKEHVVEAYSKYNNDNVNQHLIVAIKKDDPCNFTCKMIKECKVDELDK